MNPRDALTPYSLSRGAPSASWVLLHEVRQVQNFMYYNIRFVLRQGIPPGICLEFAKSMSPHEADPYMKICGLLQKSGWIGRIDFRADFAFCAGFT